MKWMSALVVVVGMSAVASGQEGAATLPKNYRVQFENAWVKVTAVRYEPMQKLPGHAHTPNPAAYVYLNDGPPVIFRHVGGSAATRAATTAGTVRVYRGLEEVHEVENTGNAPSEFLRVELKTAGLSPETLRGKFARPANMTEPVTHLEHPQIRLTRLWVPASGSLALGTSPQPALIIALASAGDVKAGQERWVPASTDVTLHNPAKAPIDFLRFDFKTAPTATAR
jgi:hypothetical protein